MLRGCSAVDMMSVVVFCGARVVDDGVRIPRTLCFEPFFLLFQRET